MNKRFEHIIPTVSAMLVLSMSWMATCGISAVACGFIASNNWLFGIILIPVTLLLAAISTISSFMYLKKVIK